jgi:hypothetical protein
MHMPNVRRLSRAWPWLGAVFAFCLATSALAQEASDPPARVAHVSQSQGSVVFAPQGEEEWVDLPQNRPLTAGDRLWSDRGGRAELQLGTATLHVDSETHLGISDLDDSAAQFMLQQGTVNARVRDLAQGENFEIGTPNVAVRALQAGDYRIDVDGQAQQTRIVVHSGLAAVYGEGGQSIHLGAGQQATFAGRSLAQVNARNYAQDAFGQWAAQRNREEDQAIAARYVPRGVVGATDLDPYGTWNQDPTYGAVWYPTVTVANWAPYRYGRWSWISPWGWTWIDDAPWGFAPFHYGRWTVIGSRWAWVPGRLAPRPVYAPALVVFLGDGGGQFSFSSGPAVGWYPLAPGEAWWPWYRTSPRYVTYANAHINLNAWPRNSTNHLWRQHAQAVTAVREEDFRRGRPVERNWQPVQPQMIDRARINAVPQRPQGRPEGGGVRAAPRVNSVPPVAVQEPVTPRAAYRNVPPLVREQFEAQREQNQLQRQAERQAREQILHPQPVPRSQRIEINPQPQQQQADPTPDRGRREGWDRGRADGNPRMFRQVQPVTVPVPRQQAVPIVREERVAPQHGQARVEGHGQHRQSAANEAQQQRGNEGRGHWNR